MAKKKKVVLNKSNVVDWIRGLAGSHISNLFLHFYTAWRGLTKGFNTAINEEWLNRQVAGWSTAGTTLAQRLRWLAIQLINAFNLITRTKQNTWDKQIQEIIGGKKWAKIRRSGPDAWPVTRPHGTKHPSYQTGWFGELIRHMYPDLGNPRTIQYDRGMPKQEEARKNAIVPLVYVPGQTPPPPASPQPPPATAPIQSKKKKKKNIQKTSYTQPTIIVDTGPRTGTSPKKKPFTPAGRRGRKKKTPPPSISPETQKKKPQRKQRGRPTQPKKKPSREYILGSKGKEEYDPNEDLDITMEDRRGDSPIIPVDLGRDFSQDISQVLQNPKATPPYVKKMRALQEEADKLKRQRERQNKKDMGIPVSPTPERKQEEEDEQKKSKTKSTPKEQIPAEMDLAENHRPMLENIGPIEQVMQRYGIVWGWSDNMTRTRASLELAIQRLANEITYCRTNPGKKPPDEVALIENLYENMTKRIKEYKLKVKITSLPKLRKRSKAKSKSRDKSFITQVIDLTTEKINKLHPVERKSETLAPSKSPSYYLSTPRTTSVRTIDNLTSPSPQEWFDINKPSPPFPPLPPERTIIKSRMVRPTPPTPKPFTFQGTPPSPFTTQSPASQIPSPTPPKKKPSRSPIVPLQTFPPLVDTSAPQPMEIDNVEEKQIKLSGHPPRTSKTALQKRKKLKEHAMQFYDFQKQDDEFMDVQILKPIPEDKPYWQAPDDYWSAKQPIRSAPPKQINRTKRFRRIGNNVDMPSPPPQPPGITPPSKPKKSKSKSTTPVIDLTSEQPAEVEPMELDNLDQPQSSKSKSRSKSRSSHASDDQLDLSGIAPPGPQQSPSLDPHSIEYINKQGEFILGRRSRPPRAKPVQAPSPSRSVTPNSLGHLVKMVDYQLGIRKKPPKLKQPKQKINLEGVRKRQLKLEQIKQRLLKRKSERLDKKHIGRRVAEKSTKDIQKHKDTQDNNQQNYQARFREQQQQKKRDRAFKEMHELEKQLAKAKEIASGQQKLLNKARDKRKKK